MENEKEKKKETILKEAVCYFTQPAFHRLFDGLRERYCALERVGGSVKLFEPTEEERDALEGLLQKNCHTQKTLTISVAAMERALKKTKFADISLKTLVFTCTKEPLISNREKRETERAQQRKHFFTAVRGLEQTQAGKWYLQVIQEKNHVYKMMVQDEKKNPEIFLKQMPQILQALDHLPIWENRKMYLPIFAADQTGDPHFFDEKNRAYHYLIYGICALLQMPYPKTPNAEQRAELLYRAGILKDDISNQVICMGMYALQKDSSRHLGIQGFYDLGQPVHLNLLHLSQLDRITAPKKEVYIVENPSVFLALAAQTKGEKALVCANGQLRLAVLLLLDFLRKEQFCMYYAGDFDPEGLLIAQHLKDRYGENLQLWHYTEVDYEQAKSRVVLEEKRLKMLEHLTDPVLRKMAELLWKNRVAGYQENLLQTYIEEKMKQKK